MKEERIVIVNPEEDVASLFESFLSIRENVPHVFYNGKDAASVIEENKPPIGLVIIDSSIRDFPCLKLAKKTKKWSSAKVMITLIYEDDSFFRNAVQLGIDKILTLPCTLKEFYSCIDDLLEA